MKTNLQRYIAGLFVLTGLVSLATKQWLDAAIWLTFGVSFVFVETVKPSNSASAAGGTTRNARPDWSRNTGYLLVLIATALLAGRMYLDFSAKEVRTSKQKLTESME
jgi:hypothetical protein